MSAWRLEVVLATCIILSGGMGCAAPARTQGPAYSAGRGLAAVSQGRTPGTVAGKAVGKNPRGPSQEAILAFVIAKNKAREAREAYAAYRSALREGSAAAGPPAAELRARFDSLFDEAVKAFERAIRLDERGAVCRREYGEFLGEFGRTGEALAQFKRAVELDPGDFPTALRLAQHYDTGGDAEQATAMYELAAKARPGVMRGRGIAAVRVRLAQLYEKTGKPQRALDEYEALLRDYATGELPGATAQETVDREAGPICDKLSALYVQTSQAERGIRFLTWFIQQTQVEQAPLALARLHFQKGDYDEAMRLARDYARRKPLESGGHSLIVEIYRAQGRLDEATAYCDGVLRERPGSTVMMRLLAELYGEAGKTDEAVGLYEEVLKRHPNVAYFYLEFAEFCLKRGRIERALRVLGEAIDKRVDVLVILQEVEKVFQAHGKELPLVAGRLAADDDVPKGFGLWYLLGEAHRQADRPRDAEAALRSSLGLNPSFLPTVVALGGIYLQEDRSEEGLAVLLQARAGGLNHPLVFNMIGMFQSKLEQYDRQVEVLTEGLGLFPNDRDLRYNRAIAFELAGDAQRSQQELEGLLAVDPEDAVVANALGYLYAEQGVNLDEAERLIRKALAEDPKNGAYIDSLGWVYFKRGKLLTARKFLEEAIRYEKDDPEILDHLGDVYLALKLVDKARAAWEKALEGSRKPRRVMDRVRRKLEELGAVRGAPGTRSAPTTRDTRRGK